MKPVMVILYMVNTGKSNLIPCNPKLYTIFTIFLCVFSVLDPDGVLRTVRYTADDHNGFQAQVILNGKPIYHAPPPPKPHHPEPSGESDNGDDDDNSGDDNSEDDEDNEYYRK